MWFGKCVLILSESFLRSRAVSEGGHEKADPVQVYHWGVAIQSMC